MREGIREKIKIRRGGKKDEWKDGEREVDWWKGKKRGRENKKKWWRWVLLLITL